MPYEDPTIAVEAALRAVMLASAPLTSLIQTKPAAKGGGPAIYNESEVYQGQTFPYITMGAWVAVKDNRFSPDLDGYGWNCTVLIKVIGQTDEARLKAVRSQIISLFPNGQSLAVSGYGSAWTDEFDIVSTINEIVNGVTTRHVPGVLRIKVHS